jgi:hypothetical protein
MITLNHSINLITEIDENKMPEHLLHAFLNLNELQMEMLLRQTFTQALNDLSVFEKINAGNSYALVKLAN